MSVDADAGTGALPDAYRDLSAFMEWALETEDQRHAKRLASTMPEIRRFYEAMAPKMEGIIKHLQGFAIGQSLEKEDHSLYLLALSYVEVSIPVELNWRQTRNEGSFPASRLHRPHRP